LRSIGCAEFIWKFLLVQGPHGSPAIDPETGAPQADIFFYYKRALMRATAVDRATRLEEKQARREQRSIDPGNIEKLAERYSSSHTIQVPRLPISQPSSSTFRHGRDWVGWNLPGEKSHQVFRTTIHQAHRADISGSQRRVEKRARQPGEILVVFFTANTPLPRCGADSNHCLFMKYKKNEGRESCSGNVHTMFRTLFKSRSHRSYYVQVSRICQCKNHL
jgi:hypothetical protein